MLLVLVQRDEAQPRLVPRRGEQKVSVAVDIVHLHRPLELEVEAVDVAAWLRLDHVHVGIQIGHERSDRILAVAHGHRDAGLPQTPLDRGLQRPDAEQLLEDRNVFDNDRDLVHVSQGVDWIDELDRRLGIREPLGIDDDREHEGDEWSSHVQCFVAVNFPSPLLPSWSTKRHEPFIDPSCSSSWPENVAVKPASMPVLN